MDFKELWKRIKPSSKIAFVIWTLVVVLLFVFKQVVVLSEVLLLWLIGSFIVVGSIQFVTRSKTNLNTIECSVNTSVISQYSTMPRFFTINQIEYDIDNPNNIRNLPLFKNTMIINGKIYGMDSVLRKHSAESYLENKDIYNACKEKLEEYAEANIKFITADELEHEKEYQEGQQKRKEDELAKIRLHDSFKIEDMYQFTEIPFEWQWVMQLTHTNGVAWFMLNMNNQAIALSYIDIINQMIVESHSYIDGIEECEIDLKRIDFMYPFPLRPDTTTNTYVECVPYTKTGKLSKYPVILHFASSEMVDYGNGNKIQIYPCMGIIKILQDGNMGAADIKFSNKIRFQFSTHGLNFILRRVDISGIDEYKNLFNYDDPID